MVEADITCVTVKKDGLYTTEPSTKTRKPVTT